MTLICYQHTTRALRDRESLRLESTTKTNHQVQLSVKQVFLCQGSSLLVITKLHFHCCSDNAQRLWSNAQILMINQPFLHICSATEQLPEQLHELISAELSISALHWGHPERGDTLCVHTCPWHCPCCVLPQTFPSWQELFLCLPHRPHLPMAWAGCWRSPTGTICP